MSSYQLPFHEALTSDDPLGIYDCENESCISQSMLLDKLIRNAQSALVKTPNTTSKTFIDLLEDIAYTIHGNGSLNTETLKSFLDQRLTMEEAKSAISNILQMAIELNQPGFSQELKYLSENNETGEIDSRLVRALLAHEALGALNIPEGNTWGIPGFLPWYADSPHHPDAVDGYLQTLFKYFQNPSKDSMSLNLRMQYANMPDPNICTERSHLLVDVVEEIHEPSDNRDGNTPFVLVAANREPGPGPTGTQEERLQASSLALTLTSLLCPVIPDDAAIITSALPVLGNWTGHNRSAKLVQVYRRNEQPERHYILADALPLDELEVEGDNILPDLLPGHVEREVKKLYAAFLGARNMSRQARLSECIIEAPPWGCGAFGGNIVIKAVCMMVASGLAGVQVHLSVTKDSVQTVDQLRKLQAKNFTVGELWKILNDRRCRKVVDLLALTTVA